MNPFDLKYYSRDQFKVKYSNPSGWYICLLIPESRAEFFDTIGEDGTRYKVLYLHKTRILDTYCGSDNFFRNRAEAYDLLNSCFVELEDDLFEI